jgi:hypothetical protein
VLPLVMIMSLCGRRAFISLRRVKMHISYPPLARPSARYARVSRARAPKAFLRLQARTSGDYLEGIARESGRAEASLGATAARGFRRKPVHRIPCPPRLEASQRRPASARAAPKVVSFRDGGVPTSRHPWSGLRAANDAASVVAPANVSDYGA